MRSLPSTDASVALAWSRIELARLLADAEARPLLETVLGDLDPARPDAYTGDEVLLARANAHADLAEHLAAAEPEAALQHRRQGVEARRALLRSTPRDPGRRVHLAQALEALARARGRAGSLSEAMDGYLEARAIYEELASFSGSAQRCAAIDEALGELTSRQGRNADAASLATRAADLLEADGEAPTEVLRLRLLAVARLVAANETEAASEHLVLLESALPYVRTRMSASESRRTTVLVELVHTSLEERRGNDREAEAHQRKAEAALEALKAAEDVSADTLAPLEEAVRSRAARDALFSGAPDPPMAGDDGDGSETAPKGETGDGDARGTDARGR